MSPKELNDAKQECTLLSQLTHPNIVEYREHFVANGELCIVMAFAEGGDLYSKIQSQRGRLFSEDDVCNYFVQILLAMKHVHARRILHRDLKSQNIFLTGGQKLIKLGDFGIAKILQNSMACARTAIGTPYVPALASPATADPVAPPCSPRVPTLGTATRAMNADCVPQLLSLARDLREQTVQPQE
jgi:NIMA (never in mitosis gene a)-related kinase